MTGGAWPASATSLREPAWLWIGGALSVFIVLAVTVGPPRIGTAATIGIVVAGNLLMGVVIDRYGLFGVDRIEVLAPRARIVLLAVGAALSLHKGCCHAAGACARTLVRSRPTGYVSRTPPPWGETLVRLAAGRPRVVRPHGPACSQPRVADRRPRRRRDDRRRLADPLDAVRRVRLGILDEHGHDRRHVERGRDQVVGEARVRDHAVARLDLLHQREPEALRGAALDLALDRLRVDRAPDVLRGPDPDDPRQAELDVDLDHDRIAATASATCARSPVIWPVSGSSGAVRGWR